ncbi:MAG: phosphoribosyl-ATP diphosphatase [Methanosarcinales archaeon Met12]|nr:MAG: phosphoribosyl-ATP diphosphatase [Methanosarcinales archaeon Met12]
MRTDVSIIREVYDVIEDRKKNPKKGSYVCSLLSDANGRILKKIEEESGELIMAAKSGDRKDIIHESADLIFHTLVVLAANDIPLEDVLNELKSRRDYNCRRKE